VTTIDDLLAEITAREKTVKVLLRQDLLAEHARLDAELVETLNVDAQENRDPLGPALAERLVELEAEIEAAKRPFRFKAVGKRAWADLLAQHPPTKDQARDHPRLDHNPETLPAAAIAATCVDPVITPEQAAQLEQALNLTQFEVLWAACLEVNVGGGDSPKSLAAGSIARASAELGITRANGASRARSSSVV
jgi:hypothetical protein